MAKVKTKFFKFRQNNSGGCFHIDDKCGLGPEVWIEAADANHANSRAENLGIYFDGVSGDRDCGCCGDRWSRSWKDEGEAEPKINQEYSFNWHDTVYVHRLNGEIERIKAPKAA